MEKDFDGVESISRVVEEGLSTEIMFWAEI